MGKAEAALTAWQEAETLYAEAGDQVGMSGSQINQAQALESMGFYRRSCNTVLQALRIENYQCERLTEESLNQVLETLQKQPNLVQGIGLRSLGNALRLIGKLSQSQQILQQSVAVAKQLQLPQDQSTALLGLGITQQALAIRSRDLKHSKAAQIYTQAAIDSYQQAAGIAQSPGNFSPFILIQAQLNKLSLLIETGQWLNAQQLLPQIRNEIAKLPPSQASVLRTCEFCPKSDSLQTK